MENNQENTQASVQGQQGQPVTPKATGMGFGVTKETRTGSVVNLPAPSKLPAPTPQFTTGYSFPVAKIVKISYNPAKEVTRNGVKETIPTLEYLFKDNKDRQFTHIEYPIDMTKDKAQDMIQWLNERVMHIWNETLGINRLPESGIGVGANSFEEYFKAVADTFNSVKYQDGDKEKVLYPTIAIYVKLTYNQDRLQLPMFPNFIQRAVDDKNQPRPQEILTINPNYDKLEPTERKKATNPYATSGGTNAEFGGGDTGADYSSFPDV